MTGPTLIRERPSEQTEPRTFAFTVVVDGCPNQAEVEAMMRLADRPSIERNKRLGTGRVVFRRNGVDLLATVLDGVRDIEAVGLRPVRVIHQDCVTVLEIADRSRRSRETVRLWTLGRLGPGGFPIPLNIGGRSALYSWAEVSRWLRERVKIEVDDTDTGLMLADLIVRMKALSTVYPL